MKENFLVDDEERIDESLILDGIVAFNKTNLKTIEVQTPDVNEARYLIDNYYQVQQMRINAANQIRALSQGTDNKSSKKELNENKIGTLNLLFNQYCVMEENAKKLLESFINSNYLAKWASQVTGIGPVLAASLAAYLHIEKEEDGSTKMHAGSWWSYAGLITDRPWLGSAKSKELVEQAIKECGGELNEDAMLLICARSKWKYEHFKNFKDCYKETKKGAKWNKEAVIKACSVIPYNKDLKVVSHKIGQSFHKVCNNDKSLYGRLYRERVQYELAKNENGDYAEQAAEILRTKNFSSKETKAIYESGKLPLGHIYKRCERWATKLFLSHAFEAAYYHEYGEMPPAPYIMCYGEKHYDYISPEIPYDEKLWKKKK